MECNPGSSQTALVDWLRFTCLWELDARHPDPRARRILELLRVDPDRFTVSGRNELGQIHYSRTLVYDEDVKVGLDPDESSRVHGAASQFIVDLSGSACRHLEERGGSWPDVISYLAGLPVRFNRVDLALDDIDGELDIDSLRRKIADQCFSSAFRARKENGRIGDEIYETGWYEPDDLDDRGMRVLDTRKGYTCQFGNRQQPVMLNIYDKLRERQSRGLLPGVGEWIRFEVSFTKGKCDRAVRQHVLPAMLRGEFGKAVAGIVRGLIEFKQMPKGQAGNVRAMSSRNVNKLPIWRPYSKFLRGAAAIRVPSDQARVEQSVTRTVRWAKGYWLNALATLFASPGEALGEVVSTLAERISRDGLSWEFVSRVRSYSRSLGREMSVEEILDRLQTYVDTLGGSVDVRRAFEERLARDRESMAASERFLEEVELGEDDLPAPEGLSREKAMLEAFDLDGL